MSNTILFVDDEPQILKSFKRVFSETTYNVLLANSGNAALEILASESVDIIITDIRMPEMDGIALLKIVKSEYPHIVRAILSGYADEKLIFQSVSQNLAKLYLYKPWQNENLLQQVERLFKMKVKLDQLKMTDSIVTYEDIPTQNQTYSKLMHLLENNVGITDIVPIIEADLAISSRVLRIANSAFYGVRTSSVKQALIFFGIKYVRELVLTCTLFSRSMSSPLISNYLQEIWNHSLLTSRILTALYEQVFTEKLPEQAYMMSLLHDVGRVVMLDQHPEVFGALYPSFKDHKSKVILEREKEALGITHQELGGLLLDWWDLPYSIVEGALYHHEPFNAETANQRLILILHLADRLSWHKPGDKIQLLVSEDILDALDLTYEQLDIFMTTITEIPFSH
jgi:HD-like signal output (HDOD) protein